MDYQEKYDMMVAECKGKAMAEREKEAILVKVAEVAYREVYVPRPKGLFILRCPVCNARLRGGVHIGEYWYLACRTKGCPYKYAEKPIGNYQ